MYLKETRYSDSPSLVWKEEDVVLQLLITNYCFPHNWPTSGARHKFRKDKRLKLTFGIHPRLVNLESRQLNNWLVDLEVLIGAKGVVAVG